MNAATTFRIQRLHLDVEFNGPEAGGLAFQARLSEWCSSWLPGVLEQVSKDFATGEELHWILDRLDLQIDDGIAPDQLEEILPGLLQAALYAALKEARPPHQAPGNSAAIGKNQFPQSEKPGSQIKTAAQNTWEAFCHFLRTGWLPWSFHLPGGQSLEIAAPAVWREAGHRPVLLAALCQTLQTKEARQRLVGQFPPAWVEEIAAALAPGQTETIRQIIRLLRRESVGGLSEFRGFRGFRGFREFREFRGFRGFREFREFREFRGFNEPLLRGIDAGQALLPLENRLWEIVLAQGAGGGSVYSVAGLLQELLAERLPAESIDLLRETAIRLTKSSLYEKTDVPAGLHRALQFALQDWLELSRSGAPDVADSSDDSKSSDEYGHNPSDNPKPSGKLEQGVKLAGSSSNSRAEFPGEGVYIGNAGLVLLHPFIPLFFETAGVAADGKLTNPGKALSLLHFLVSGETTAPEHELLLPKILCGLSPDTVSGAGVRLDDNDIAESIHVLNTAIQYWEALKNTSPDGLRDTFLKRPGKVSRRESDWLVQVERQSFDILLDDLPWGLSVLQFPWMTGLVWVEW